MHTGEQDESVQSKQYWDELSSHVQAREHWVSGARLDLTKLQRRWLFQDSYYDKRGSEWSGGTENCAIEIFTCNLVWNGHWFACNSSRMHTGLQGLYCDFAKLDEIGFQRLWRKL